MGRPVSPEAIQRQKDYVEQYQRENLKRVTIKLNTKTDADIIEHLEAVNKNEKTQTYIKRLIREDM